jgi:hypothetical protein
MEMTPPLRDSNDCWRDILGVGGWLNRKVGFLDEGTGLAWVRVATPGVWMMDLLLTGVYMDRSELARVIDALEGWGFPGFGEVQADSDTIDILFSDMALACSKAGSSTRFNNLLAS